MGIIAMVLGFFKGPARPAPRPSSPSSTRGRNATLRQPQLHLAATGSSRLANGDWLGIGFWLVGLAQLSAVGDSARLSICFWSGSWEVVPREVFVEGLDTRVGFFEWR